MASQCKRLPLFFACEFQVPMGAYSGEFGNGKWSILCHNHKTNSVSHTIDFFLYASQHPQENAHLNTGPDRHCPSARPFVSVVGPLQVWSHHRHEQVGGQRECIRGRCPSSPVFRCAFSCELTNVPISSATSIRLTVTDFSAPTSDSQLGFILGLLSQSVNISSRHLSISLLSMQSRSSFEMPSSSPIALHFARAL